jgi:uncharacterized RDD family membrane protein YckC
MNTIHITTSQNIDVEYDLASLGERIAGYMIDLLIVIAYIIVLMLVNSFSHSLFGDNGWVLSLFFIPILFYDLACETLLNGQSVGKKIMKIKVISIDGSQPSLGQYIIRWLFRLVDFTLSNDLCALISVAVSENKQRLGDLVAGTTLIRTQPRVAFQQTIYSHTAENDYLVSFPTVVNLSDKDMQLIREVTLQIHKTGNTFLAYHAAEKIKQVLQIQSGMEPSQFLQVIISDYNHLTSRQT